MVEAPTVQEASSLAGLMQEGFTPHGAQHYAEMRRRYEAGDFSDLAGRNNHVTFVIWLIDNGRLTDELADDAAPSKAPVRAAA
jgi:hypothetical protein